MLARRVEGVYSADEFAEVAKKMKKVVVEVITNAYVEDVLDELDLVAEWVSCRKLPGISKMHCFTVIDSKVQMFETTSQYENKSDANELSDNDSSVNVSDADSWVSRHTPDSEFSGDDIDVFLQAFLMTFLKVVILSIMKSWNSPGVEKVLKVISTQMKTVSVVVNNSLLLLVQ